MCEYESKELLEYMNITYNCLYTQVLEYNIEYRYSSIIYYTVGIGTSTGTRRPPILSCRTGTRRYILCNTFDII